MSDRRLISDEYRRLNERLHAGGRFGGHGDKWAETVNGLIARFQPRSILDYGCGQGRLALALAVPIAEYDPAIAGKATLPEPADLVICTDVIEHIEPASLAAVLDHLAALTRCALFAVVSTRPAQKLLEDGRNAHLIVQPPDYWRERFAERFVIDSWAVTRKDVIGTFLPRSG